MVELKEVLFGRVDLSGERGILGGGLGGIGAEVGEGVDIRCGC